jgi:hypothetical protein
LSRYPRRVGPLDRPASAVSRLAELTRDRPATAFGLPKVLFRTPRASGERCTPALPWGDLPVADFVPRSLVAGLDPV